MNGYANIHGLFIAISEIFSGLSKTLDSFDGLQVQIEKMESLIGRIPDSFLDGFGSEIVLEAICHFIKILSAAKFVKHCQNAKKMIEKWFKILEVVLKRPEETLQASGVDAFKELFLEDHEFEFETIISRFVTWTGPEKPKTAKRGFSLALAVLPCNILCSNHSMIIDSLILAATLLVC